MRFFCNGCQQELPFSECRFWRVEDKKDALIRRFCKGCVSGTVTLHDIYWDGKPEENLADDPVTGKPPVFLSKGQKAAYLKERGMMEAGDRVHGAPFMSHKNQERKVDTKHEVQMALKHVREMGIDVRRQEYLKITKEGRRYA